MNTMVTFLCVFLVACSVSESFPLIEYTDAFQPKRIFGGSLAPEYKCSMAYIVLSGGGYCTGVIVSNNYVATAAHCFARVRSVSDLNLYLGDAIRGTTAHFSVEAVYSLAAYGSWRTGGDVGMIKMGNHGRRDICKIPLQSDKSGDPVDGDEAIAVGYGLVHSNGQGTEDLKKASIRVATNVGTVHTSSGCNAPSGNSVPATLCAVAPVYPKSNEGGTCRGYSEGLLITWKYGPRLFGLNSYSWTACDAPSNIDFFARVRLFAATITNLMKNNESSSFKRLAYTTSS